MSTAARLGTPLALPQRTTDAGTRKPVLPGRGEAIATDAAGRRRFHGAFTGGFVAGYHNTVGSAEGFTPASFSSSRAARAGSQQQLRPQDFMDDEDDPLMGQRLLARQQYDTLGDRSAAAAASAAASEAVGSAAGGAGRQVIPGPVPTEWVVPSAVPVGKQLLQTMGWKEGQGLGPRQRHRPKTRRPTTLAAMARKADDPPPTTRVFGPQRPTEANMKQAVEAKNHDSQDSDSDDDPYAEGKTFAPKNTATFRVVPKNDLYGLGFEPHKNAPEFALAALTAAAASKTSSRTLSMNVNAAVNASANFGVGVLEDEDDGDVYGIDDKSRYVRELDVEDDGPKLLAQSEANDIRGDALTIYNAQSRRCSDGNFPLKGFVLATHSSLVVPKFTPIRVPPNFDGTHVNRVSRFDKGSAATDTSQLLKAAQAAGSMNANVRGAILGEKQLPGSVAVRVAPSALAPAPQSAVTERAQAVIKSRFVTSSSTATVSAPGMEGGLFSADAFSALASVPSTEQAASKPPAKEPVHTEKEWVPAALLCKRFNVPDPYKGRVRPTEGVSTSEAFHEEMVALADPFGGPVAGGNLSALQAAIAAADMDDAEPARQASISGFATGLTGPVALGVSSRPTVDLFSAIFQADDSDSDDSDGEEGASSPPARPPTVGADLVVASSVGAPAVEQSTPTVPVSVSTPAPAPMPLQAPGVTMVEQSPSHSDKLHKSHKKRHHKESKHDKKHSSSHRKEHRHSRHDDDDRRSEHDRGRRHRDRDRSRSRSDERQRHKSRDKESRRSHH